MSTRIGLFGGTFNPIHHGHLIAARAVAEQAGLARVILIPSAIPPHKSGDDLAPARHRLEMVRLAVADDPLFDVSDLEMKREGPSYTFDTVGELQQRLGKGVRLAWIIGADTLPELVLWSRIEQLVQRVEFLIAARRGWEAPDLSRLRAALGEAAVARLLAGRVETPLIEISARAIRDRVRQGLSIRYLTPAAVEAYIAAQNLYRPTPAA